MGSPPKNRPVVVIQSDYYNSRISNVLLAHVTSNLARTGDDGHVFVDVSTVEGQQTGLNKDSLVSCINLSVLRQSDVQRKIGQISGRLLQELNAALKFALDLQ